ncbi:MAG: ABC transporter ATP-binding protein [Lachnospiraceae bacterium]|nr:ABC transporter ATP-binding protein [Lachnospiraceae bacterium]
MMKEAVRLEHVSKSYTDFLLDDISFSVPGGCIMGLIGENGAGKTTILKSILQLIHLDQGKIYLFGEEYDGSRRERLNQIGVVMDRCYFEPELTASEINKVLSKVYANWQTDEFFSYLDRFSINPALKIKEYSKGMSVKISLAAALSHQSRLLILDEPASGLDPAAREELLDLFWDFIQEEDRSILLSSHIVTDLEKVCDYITYINNGKLLFSEDKDILLQSYGIVKCSRKELSVLEPEAVIATRIHSFGAEALVKRNHIPDGMLYENAGIEQIMIFQNERRNLS